MEETKLTHKSETKPEKAVADQSAPDSKDEIVDKAMEKALPNQDDVLGSGSWGALLGIFYLIAMRAWVWVVVVIALSVVSGLFPSLGIISAILMIYLIIKGKDIAWKSRKWKDFQEFLTVQRAWDLAGKIIFGVQIFATIGILATVVLVSLSSARFKALDAKRKADVNTIVIAIEAYRADNQDVCPANLSALTSKYYDSIPKDPTTKSDYAYKIDGENCVVSANLDVEGDPSLKNDFNPTNGAIYDKASVR